MFEAAACPLLGRWTSAGRAASGRRPIEVLVRSIPPDRIMLVHGGIGMHRELLKTKLNES
jgi:hypothetical protein